jgi:hypothetical protein
MVAGWVVTISQTTIDNGRQEQAVLTRSLVGEPKIYQRSIGCPDSLCPISAWKPEVELCAYRIPPKRLTDAQTLLSD